MQMLAQLFNARARAAVIQLLFGSNKRSMYLNEISQVTGMASRSIEVELKNLTKLGLLVTQADRSRIYYSANRSNPACAPLESLVAASADQFARLQEALAVSDTEFVFFPTQYLLNLRLPEIDLPIVVVHRKSGRDLQEPVRAAAQSAGVSLVPEFISVEALRRGASSHDPHISAILASPRTFVVGSDSRFIHRIQPSNPGAPTKDRN